MREKARSSSIVKRLLAIFAALAMVLTMGVGSTIPAMASTTGGIETGTEFTYIGTDRTTNGEITMQNATKDTTYTLYKIFDATHSGDNVAYTIKAGNLKDELTTNGTDYFTIATSADENGNYSVTRPGTTSEGTFTPTKSDSELITYLSGLKTSLFTNIGSIKSTVNGTIEWKNIPYGYYMIVPDQGLEPNVAITIDNATPTRTVIDKNQTPSFDKNILQTVDDETAKVKTNEAGLNEDVNFEIEVNAKNYDKTNKIFKYVIFDTLDAGWTLKAAPVVKVTSGDTTTTLDSNTTGFEIKYYTDSNKTTEAKSDLSDAQYFEITVYWTNDGTNAGTSLYASNAAIDVTYSAKLDSAKAAQVKVGATPNKNTADVKYYKGNDTDTPSGDLPDKETETYDTSITINKVDGDDKALANAEFTLTTNDGTKVAYISGVSWEQAADGTYYRLKDGTFTSTKPTADTQDQYDNNGTTAYKQVKTNVVGAGQTVTNMRGFVDEQGHLTFSGLGVGTYTLSETVVPAGYNRAADITFTISFDAATKKFSSSNNAVSLTGEDTNVFSTKVMNLKGSTLPSTGGIGTTIFYVIGGVLVAGAVILLVSRRRRA